MGSIPLKKAAMGGGGKALFRGLADAGNGLSLAGMSWVLFFDGDCGFCSKSVRRVHRLDKSGLIDFAPLQGELAGEKGFGKYAEKGAGTMVLMREGDGLVFLRSEALVELGKVLGGGWAVLGRCLSFVPRGLRDWGYDFVARNRHRLAGYGRACGIPDEGLRRRMRD